MPYLLFLKKSGKICNCRLLQIIGGALRVNLEILTCDALICTMNHSRLKPDGKKSLVFFENLKMLLIHVQVRCNFALIKNIFRPVTVALGSEIKPILKGAKSQHGIVMLGENNTT